MAKILVIDDNSRFALMVERVLRQENHEVLIAQDGMVGLRLFLKHSPAVVITDVVMPEKEGITTIREVREIAPGAKILAVSGAVDDSFSPLELASEFGADMTLAKPFRAATLLAAVNELLAGRRHH